MKSCRIYVKFKNSILANIVVTCEEESWVSSLETEEGLIWIEKRLNDSSFITRSSNYFQSPDWYTEEVEYSLIYPLFNKMRIEDFKSYIMSILSPELSL